MEYITENTTFTTMPMTWIVTTTDNTITSISYEYVEDLYYDEETDSYM
jgi:hypothetical protein